MNDEYGRFSIETKFTDICIIQGIDYLCPFLTENRILEPDWNGKTWKSFIQNNSVLGFNFLVNNNESVLKVDTQQQSV